MKKITLLTMITTVSGGLISACAPLDITSVPPTYETLLSPPIGETASAQTGDPIIEMTHALSVPAIKFMSDCSFDERRDLAGTGTVTYTVSRDAVFTRDNLTNGVPGYCGTPMQYTPPLGHIPVAHCVAVNGNNLVAFPGSGRLLTSNCQVKPHNVMAEDKDSIKRQLLYDGKSGTTLHLSYREFYGDMARPAFTQEVSYDLAQDTVIGFKGARFEVMEANNTGIRYRVLKGF